MDGAHCEDVGGNSNEEVGSHQTETNDEIKKLQDLLNQLSTPLEESEAVEEPTYLDDGAAKFATQQNTLARTLLPMRSFVSSFTNYESFKFIFKLNICSIKTYYTGLLFDWFPRGRAQSLREYWPSTVVIICSITILFATILFFLSQMFSKAMSVGAELSLFHILLPSFMWCFPLFLACFTQIYYLNLILCNKIQQFLQHWRLLEESLKRLPIATNTNNSHSSRISRCVRNMKKIDVRVYWVIFTLQISLFSTSLYFITQSTMQCTDSFQINPAANDNMTQSTEQNSNGQGNTDKFLVFPLSCDLEEMIEISDTSSSQPATYYSDTTTFDEAVGNRSRNASNRLMLVMAVNGTDYKSSTEASRNAINKLFLMDYPQLNCGHYNCKWICYFYACLHIASMVLVTVFVSLADLVPAFVYSHAATAAHTLRDFILRTDIPVTVQVANPTADSGESLTPTEKHFFRIWLHYEAIRVMVKRADSLFGLLVN